MLPLSIVVVSNVFSLYYSIVGKTYVKTINIVFGMLFKLSPIYCFDILLDVSNILTPAIVWELKYCSPFSVLVVIIDFFSWAVVPISRQSVNAIVENNFTFIVIKSIVIVLGLSNSAYFICLWWTECRSLGMYTHIISYSQANIWRIPLWSSSFYSIMLSLCEYEVNFNGKLRLLSWIFT